MYVYVYVQIIIKKMIRSEEVRLNCRITIPVIGLGTYSSNNHKETTEQAIHMALKVRTFLVHYSSSSPLFFFYIYKKKSLSSKRKNHYVRFLGKLPNGILPESLLYYVLPIQYSSGELILIKPFCN